MAVGAFPIAKLAVLGIKHISKPVGKLMKNTAKKNKFFRKYICTPPAHLYNWVEVRSKLWMLGMKQPKRVPTLSKSMAIDVGGDMLGEFIIFFIGASMIILEFSRQARNERYKHEQHKLEKKELGESIEKLHNRVYQQANEIESLKKQIITLGTELETERNSGHVEEEGCL